MIPIARETGHGGRVWRPRARGRSAAEVSQLTRDADLHEESNALWAELQQRRPAQGALLADRRGLLRFRTGLSSRRTAGRRDVRHGAHAAAGADAAPLRGQGAALLRPRSRRPDCRGTQLASCSSAKASTSTSSGSRKARIPTISSRSADARRLSSSLDTRARISSSCSIAPRPEHDLARDDSRREFLKKMLGVASRIPDPAVRDQFADRLAHKAKVTEEVVRAEIRKAAAARKTELPAERLPSLMTRVLASEKGLLWSLMHDPAATLPWLAHLEPEDLKGLSTAQHPARWPSKSDRPTRATPNALMERLNTVEAELLAAMAAEASAPVSRPDVCVQSLKRRRLEREQAEVQREIDRFQAQGRSRAGPERTVETKINGSARART